MPSTLKNFLITFGISLVIFGVAAYFTVGYLNNEAFANKDNTGKPIVEGGTTAAEETTAPDNPGDDTTTVNGTSFNLLLIGTDFQSQKLDDYDPDLWIWSLEKYEPMPISEATELRQKGFFTYRKPCADSMVLLRIDKERRSFTYTYIPGSMRLADNGNISLGSLYAIDGNEEGTADGLDLLRRKVEALTGLKIDYYLSVNIDTIADVINTVGNVKVEVPCDMKYEDPKQELVIDLKKGTRKLSGDEAAALLRFNNYAGGGATRGNMTVGFIKALIENCTTVYGAANIPTLYDKLKDKVDTNITKEFLVDQADLLFSYSKFTVSEIGYPGSYITDDSGRYVFIPEIKNAIDTFYNYRLPISKTDNN